MLRAASAFTALTVLALAGPATAADLSPAPAYKAPLVAPAPMYSWTGLYIGGHVGGAWGDETSTNITTIPGFVLAGTQVKGSPSGFIGGGQIGANYQFGTWVLGIEADGSWADVNESVTTATLAPGVNARGTSDTNWYSTVTGRVGYAAGNVLFYGKGGVAWAGIDYTAATLAAGTGAVIAGPAAISDTRTGWTVGAGLEFGFWNNWSAKIEYDYLDFGTERYVFTVGGVPNTVDIDTQVHMLKAGLNYRFGGLGGF